MYYLRQNPASQTNRFTVDIKIQQYYTQLTGKDSVVRGTTEQGGSVVSSNRAEPEQEECSGEACVMCQA